MFRKRLDINGFSAFSKKWVKFLMLRFGIGISLTEAVRCVDTFYIRILNRFLVLSFGSLKSCEVLNRSCQYISFCETLFFGKAVRDESGYLLTFVGCDGKTYSLFTPHRLVSFD